MAKTMSSSFSYLRKPHKKRTGIISNCKSSNSQTSKHYVKKYRGQGRA